MQSAKKQVSSFDAEGKIWSRFFEKKLNKQ